MKETFQEMRRLVRSLMLLLILTCFALLAASVVLIRTNRLLMNNNNDIIAAHHGIRENNMDVFVSVYDDDIVNQDLRKNVLRNLPSYDRLVVRDGGYRRVFLENLHNSPSRAVMPKQELDDQVNQLSQTRYLDEIVSQSSISNSKDHTAISENISAHVVNFKQNLTKEHLLITIKTTKKYHSTRLKLIAQTWYTLVPNQTMFFSDAALSADEALSPGLSSRLVVTDCPSSHHRRALCCKMARELDAFLESQAKWWCHFDDDNYVNIEALLDTLGQYDSRAFWYLGRPSIRAPLEILDRDDVTKRIAFWFATGGAGFCVSRALALQMMPIAGGGKLISVGDKIRLPDDVTIGYIIEHLLRQRLTVLEQFHSHLESMQFLDPRTLHKQVSLSYSTAAPHSNLLDITGLHPKLDPTRMLSLHCLLHPSTSYCPK